MIYSHMSDTDSMFPDADAFIDEEELNKIVEDTKQKILVFGVGGAGSNTISMMAQKKDMFESESAEWVINCLLKCFLHSLSWW